MDNDDWKQIIHNKCGLPVEFCECNDADIIYHPETDTFTVKGDNEENQNN